MLKRKAYDELEAWKQEPHRRALLVTGARQVGKTYLIEQFAQANYDHVAKLDLIEQADARAALNAASSAEELFMAISAFARTELVPHETVVFIDEAQEAKEIVSFVKYLVQRADGIDYILSGSLLGVELGDIRSVPVGYLKVVDMFPLDFEEFCWAAGVGRKAWGEVEAAFQERRPVFSGVHERLLSLFHRYLVVGGMPAAVQEFTDTQNIARVHDIQSGILRLYRRDVSKYAERGKKLAIKEILDQMPSQLDSQSKRFNFASIAAKGTYERYAESFLWLVDAGVAIPVMNVLEPKRPLRLSEDRSFFKLFMNDVGLLSAACGMQTVRDALAGAENVRYGSIYENAVACELFAHSGGAEGAGVRFFRNRKAGELDFVKETNMGEVLPIEVKSGKAYKRHSALTNVLATPNYGIEQAVVLCEGNVSVSGKVSYLPVYMAAFL